MKSGLSASAYEAVALKLMDLSRERPRCAPLVVGGALRLLNAGSARNGFRRHHFGGPCCGGPP